MAAARTLQDVREFFSWDKNSLRYRDPKGRFVKPERVRRALLRVVDGAKRGITALAQKLTTGEVNVAQWQEQMERAVKDLHLAATMAAKGGRAMTARDYGLAGARLRAHYEYIDKFARDIEGGRVPVGRIISRSKLYAAAASGVYQNARREAARKTMTHERRVLGNAEHCDVCVTEAAKGWQPIGTLLPLGRSPCRANCKCSFRFKKSRV